MPPLAPDQSQEAISLLQEALKGLPVLAVMWYMLRDVRTAVVGLSSRIRDLELKVANDTDTVRLGHLEERLKEFRAEHRNLTDESIKRLTLIDSQLLKVWAKIGDRPEDIRNRNGESA